MPCVTLHLRLAERVLEHWRRHPRGAPFDPSDGTDAAAFHMGAMGPDMGYFPGGYRPISDLAHTISPGVLTRNLLASAGSPRQQAFSWGWVTHLLADVLVHPLIGCAVGQTVHGSPARFVGADADPVNHIRVEAGLDALYALQHPELRRLPLAPVFDAASVGFIREAYLGTYGAAPDADRFLHAHLLAPRRMAQGLALAGISGAGLPDHLEHGGRPAGTMGRLRGFIGRRTVSLAFLLPAAPPLWLINAVRDVEENFVDLLLEEHRLDGAALPDANLDTGRHYLDDPDHGGFRRSMAYLLERGGSPPALRLTARGAA